jgi:polyisoprenoid-binding protein YceI
MGLKFPAMLAIAALSLGLSFTASQAGSDKGDYKIDPRHTQVIFTIQHMGLSHFFGRFSNVTGTMPFDPDAVDKSTLNATIDISTISTHVPELDKELKDLFQADKFPTATFTSTQITKTGANTGTVTGNLTIAGVTKPVTLNVVFDGGRDSPFPFQPHRIGFDATATIKRSDFGLTHTMWSSVVSDDVALQIECEMERQ